MLYQLLTATLLAFCVFSEGDDEAVVTLTTDNFDDFVTSHPRVLVEFYAPWCGHCKALAPEYEKAAQKLHNDPDMDVYLAKVDATVEKELSGKYGVRGFPTLKYFTGDVENPADYSGGRTESTIVSWLSKRSQPAVSVLSTSDEVDQFKSKNRLVLAACVEGDKDSNEQVGAFYDVCETLRESLSCAQITDKSICGDSTVLLYRQFDEPIVSFTGTEVTKESILEFANSERFPLLDQIGPDNYKDYMDRGLPLVWIALDGNDESQLKSVSDSVLEAAKANKGKLSFTWIDNNKYAQHVGNLGLKDVPGLIIVDGSDKYIFDGDILNSESVTQWFVKYSNGEVSKFLKTEPVPESNDEDVFVVVGSTFDSVVGGDKDVFLEFYAPWCGHCKKLAPEYEKVGAAFKNVDSVLVAKIDATENDTPEPIKGFPTLIWYPAGSKEGKKYEGGRTAEAIVSFIEENQSNRDHVTNINKEEL